MYEIRNLFDNPNITMVDQKGPFTVMEHEKDLSVTPEMAQLQYFCAQMGVRKRQLVANVGMAPITTQAGAMQWTIGDTESTTGVKGVGDLVKKSLRGSVTGESAIKPEYVSRNGEGMLVLEPTYKHIVLLDVAEWGNSVILDDGYFLACDARLRQKAVAKSSISGALGGKQGGLFNLCIEGQGVVALESPVPYVELMEVELHDDVLKVDGPMAIAWSRGLSYTVERSSKSLIGSAVNGEGLVNVYRGTGKVLMATVS